MVGGAAGSDTIVAGPGDTTITLQDGDMAYATLGVSTTYGCASGSDIIAVGGVGAVVYGGAGDNEFIGAAGDSTIYGGTGNDTVFTGGQMDAVLGSGDDTVVLATGSADIFAGSGIDLFDVVAGAAGGATDIYGFNATNDSLDLFGYAAGDVQSAEVNGSTVLTLSDQTTITLVGISQVPTLHFG
jgi:serralysin